MSNISEKVAYIKGLAEGLKISEETAEGKVLLSIIDVLTEMADSIADLDDDIDELDDYVSAMDEDLAELEAVVFEEDED